MNYTAPFDTSFRASDSELKSKLVTSVVVIPVSALLLLAVIGLPRGQASSRPSHAGRRRRPGGRASGWCPGARNTVVPVLRHRPPPAVPRPWLGTSAGRGERGCSSVRSGAAGLTTGSPCVGSSGSRAGSGGDPCANPRAPPGPVAADGAGP